MKQLARLSIFIILILVIEFLVVVGFSEWWLVSLSGGCCIWVVVGANHCGHIPEMNYTYVFTD